MIERSWSTKAMKEKRVKIYTQEFEIHAASFGKIIDIQEYEYPIYPSGYFLEDTESNKYVYIPKAGKSPYSYDKNDFNKVECEMVKAKKIIVKDINGKVIEFTRYYIENPQIGMDVNVVAPKSKYGKPEDPFIWQDGKKLIYKMTSTNKNFRENVKYEYLIR